MIPANPTDSHGRLPSYGINTQFLPLLKEVGKMLINGAN